MSYHSGSNPLAGNGGLIQASDYNRFSTYINKLVADARSGTDSTQIGVADYGYGLISLASGQVTAGGTIYASDWTKILGNVTAIGAHTGYNITPLVPSVTISGKVIAFNDYSTQSFGDVLANLAVSRFNTATGQLTFTQNPASTSSAGWTTGSSYVYQVDFGTWDNARYFFNTGGNLALTGSYMATGGVTGTLASVQVLTSGSGYTSVPTVVFTGGGATTPAQATAVVTSGAVTAINLTNVGAGYTSTPNVTLQGGLPGGSGTVVSVRINDGGALYTAAPQITFTGGSPTTPAQATAYLTINGTAGQNEWSVPTQTVFNPYAGQGFSPGWTPSMIVTCIGANIISGGSCSGSLTPQWSPTGYYTIVGATVPVTTPDGYYNMNVPYYDGFNMPPTVTAHIVNQQIVSVSVGSAAVADPTGLNAYYYGGASVSITWMQTQYYVVARNMSLQGAILDGPGYLSMTPSTAGIPGNGWGGRIVANSVQTGFVYNAGYVSSVIITNPGSGYTSTPTMQLTDVGPISAQRAASMTPTLSSGSSGVAATAAAVLSSAITPSDTFWSTFLTRMGTVNFGAHRTTSSAGAVYNIGFYSLTSSYSEIYRQIPISSDTYQTNFMSISAKTNSTPGTDGKITFTVTLNDKAASTPVKSGTLTYNTGTNTATGTINYSGPITTSSGTFGSVSAAVFPGPKLSLSTSPSNVAGKLLSAGTFTSPTITVTASGGTGPYTYVWSNVTGTVTFSSASTNATTISRVMTLGEIADGVVKVVVTDFIGNVATKYVPWAIYCDIPNVDGQP